MMEIRRSKWHAMSAVVFGLMVATTLASDADPGSRERLFLKALERFDSAKSSDDYRESAKLLESIVADGFQNGAVYYNLGNAYYRAGEFGRAIINYRKALPYRPGDPYLAANLQQAVAAAPGRLSDSPRPWWTHVLFWTDWLSFPRKIQTTAIAIIAAAIVSTLSVLLQQRRLRWVTAALLMISLAVGIDAGLCYRDTMNPNRAVITGSTIARKGTDNSYEPAFDLPLKDGAEFTILSQTPDWTFGRFEPIGDGWVRNEFVAR
jgi:tetratricopeptide (TPR) repeat protein